jgi:hypothetical protein
VRPFSGSRLLTCVPVFTVTKIATENIERRLGQGRCPAADLSSFRTYLVRLSAGYGGFRSGENESSLKTGPVSPTVPDFFQALLTSRRPVLPQPGAVLLGNNRFGI